jgi:hypothetical protein
MQKGDFKMKNKLVFGLLVFFFGLATLAPNHLSAAVWADANVDRVLQGTTMVQTRLTDVNGTFTSKLFKIDNEKTSAMLAILLTAYSLEKTVRIAFNDGDPASIILVGINE